MSQVRIWTPVPACSKCAGALRKLHQGLFMCNDCHTYFEVVDICRCEKEVMADVYSQEEWHTKMAEQNT